MVRQLKLKKALPVLEARLRGDHLGFGGDFVEVLEATINELTEQAEQATRRHLRLSSQPQTIAELEKQVADLQKTAEGSAVKSPTSNTTAIGLVRPAVQVRAARIRA